MAMYDWDNNGKNDIMDDFIEYNIYQEVMNENDDLSDTHYSGNGGCSAFTAVLIAISGLLIQAILYTAAGIDAGNVPGIVVLFLWIFFDWLVLMGLMKIGKF